ncbi:MAG: hypothetical protein HGB02_08470 [Chlorobiaceae bacterium]|nr:hypothetical protein [Chlorobiaceae bacterium]
MKALALRALAAFELRRACAILEAWYDARPHQTIEAAYLYAVDGIRTGDTYGEAVMAINELKTIES